MTDKSSSLRTLKGGFVSNMYKGSRVKVGSEAEDEGGIGKLKRRRWEYAHRVLKLKNGSQRRLAVVVGSKKRVHLKRGKEALHVISSYRAILAARLSLFCQRQTSINCVVAKSSEPQAMIINTQYSVCCVKTKEISFTLPSMGSLECVHVFRTSDIRPPFQVLIPVFKSL